MNDTSCILMVYSYITYIIAATNNYSLSINFFCLEVYKKKMQLVIVAKNPEITDFPISENLLTVTKCCRRRVLPLILNKCLFNLNLNLHQFSINVFLC